MKRTKICERQRHFFSYTLSPIPFALLFFFFTLYPTPYTLLYAADSANLQFTVAAPDPIMAGDEVKFQTLVVNTGNTTWSKGSYYWSAEIYTIEEGEHKFFASAEPMTPAEDVPPSGAHGVQISFVIPENFTGKRLLYRVFLIKDGKRLVETDYRGFQVIEKEFKPPPPTDFKIGGDVTFSYKNSSLNGWDNHQAVTAANIVGKVKNSSFLFNTYLIHTRHKPVNVNIILLNAYTPWGIIGAGDISPSLTPLSLDNQGMRGMSWERQKNKTSWTLLVGRIVAPEEPSNTSAGRFARYTGGFKLTYNLRQNLKVSVDSVLNEDDDYSITINTNTSVLRPQRNLLYGSSLEWKFLNDFTFISDYQISSFNSNVNHSTYSTSGSAWREEIRYKSDSMAVRAYVSQIGTDYRSFSSPSIIPDRFVYNAELNLYPVDWTSFSAGYNKYNDNLKDVPSKTTTDQTQMNLSNSLKLPSSSILNTSYLTNKTLGKPSSVQNNQTNTVNISIVGIYT